MRYCNACGDVLNSTQAVAECSLTFHPTANGYPVETLGRQRRRGEELASLHQMSMALEKRPFLQAFTSYNLTHKTRGSHTVGQGFDKFFLRAKCMPVNNLYGIIQQ